MKNKPTPSKRPMSREAMYEAIQAMNQDTLQIQKCAAKGVHLLVMDPQHYFPKVRCHHD